MAKPSWRMAPMILWLMAVLGSGAEAADLPADCSAGPPSDAALQAAVNGKTFDPVHVALIENTQTMGQREADGGLTFAGHRFEIADNAGLFDKKFKIEVTVATRRGQAVDGQVYRILPSDELSDQPMLPGGDGLTVVQAWGIEGPELGRNVRGAFNVASMHLSFDQRDGGRIGGTIAFCLAPDQVEYFSKTPVGQSYAIGRFEAVIVE